MTTLTDSILESGRVPMKTRKAIAWAHEDAHAEGRWRPTPRDIEHSITARGGNYLMAYAGWGYCRDESTGEVLDCTDSANADRVGLVPNDSAMILLGGFLSWFGLPLAMPLKVGKFDPAA